MAGPGRAKGHAFPEGYAVDWQARCLVLEARDQERARELAKANTNARLCHKQADELRRQLADANKNAARFHALLLQERVRKLPERA